jgi:D-glycero-alpha-D-manno-heptose-7-phosphate kinase
MLAQNWELKKRLGSGITFALLDSMYEIARLRGAIGGKVCGAGGGGFLVLWVPPVAQASVRSALCEYRELECEFCENGSEPISERVITTR